jgi:hypothetical protein
MHTLRRITVGSAFKVGAALSALLFAVLGFFVVLLPGIFGAGILGALLGDQGGRGAFGLGFVGSLIAYVLGIVIYWIVGGIVFAIEAWLYNIVAGRIGGLQIEIS